MNNHIRRQQQHEHRACRTNRSYPESANVHQSPDCSLSICYSYLIAIFSSFLVVLGIYLSLTKFNAHFLYISLAGLLIEATGACIYCLSNIHKSKLARRKQTNNLSIENDNQQPIRQREVTTMTNMLNNRTLNQSAINSSTAQTNEQRNNPSIHGPSCSRDNNNSAQQGNQINRPSTDSNSSIETLGSPVSANQAERPVIENSNEQLPKTQSCQNGVTESPIITSPNDTHDNHAIETSINSPQLDNRQPGDQTSSTEIAEPLQSLTQVCADESTGGDETDLINLQRPPAVSSGGLQVTNDSQAPRRQVAPSNHHGHRAANIRRTLVMGLSGEEEVIEIDEEDLDNMSILPPSYESIATNSKHQ